MTMTNQKDRTEKSRQIVEWMPDDVMEYCEVGLKQEPAVRLYDDDLIDLFDDDLLPIEILWQSLDLQQEVLGEIEERGLIQKYRWILMNLLKITPHMGVGVYDLDKILNLAPEDQFQAIVQTIEGCE